MQSRDHKIVAGFTIVELVAVIVLLGILAAVALPRFLSADRQARIAALESMRGTLETTTAMAHMACKMTNGCDSGFWGQVFYLEPFDMNVQMLRGYPDAGEIARTDQIDDMLTHSGLDLSSEDGNETARWSIPGTTNCYVQYRQVADVAGAIPTISMQTSGC